MKALCICRTVPGESFVNYLPVKYGKIVHKVSPGTSYGSTKFHLAPLTAPLRHLLRSAVVFIFSRLTPLPLSLGRRRFPGPTLGAALRFPTFLILPLVSRGSVPWPLRKVFRTFRQSQSSRLRSVLSRNCGSDRAPWEQRNRYSHWPLSCAGPAQFRGESLPPDSPLRPPPP